MIREILGIALWAGLAVIAWIFFMVFVLWASGKAEQIGNRPRRRFNDGLWRGIL